MAKKPNPQPADLNTVFSNSFWAVQVRTVGEMVDELLRLPACMPIRHGLSVESADLVIINRSTEPYLDVEEGGFFSTAAPAPNPCSPASTG